MFPGIDVSQTGIIRLDRIQKVAHSQRWNHQVERRLGAPVRVAIPHDTAPGTKGDAHFPRVPVVPHAPRRTLSPPASSSKRDRRRPVLAPTRVLRVHNRTNPADRVMRIPRMRCGVGIGCFPSVVPWRGDNIAALQGEGGKAPHAITIALRTDILRPHAAAHSSTLKRCSHLLPLRLYHTRSGVPTRRPARLP